MLDSDGGVLDSDGGGGVLDSDGGGVLDIVRLYVRGGGARQYVRGGC